MTFLSLRTVEEFFQENSARHLLCACCLLVLAIWLSSGTLTPYAFGLSDVKIISDCQYFANPDHRIFTATFNFLDGAPKESWAFSIVLRRILLPLFSYPFMKLLGFMLGGLIANIIFHIMMLISFWYYLKKKMGGRIAKIGVYLLATYPGITYWAGLPYSYAAIVPCCIWAVIVLIEIEQNSSCKNLILGPLIIGILFLGYDIFPFILPTLLLILIKKKKFLYIPISLTISLFPLFLWSLLLKDYWGQPPANSNTVTYLNIVHSFLSSPDLVKWFKLIIKVPWTIVNVYFFCNFVFLPLLFLIIVKKSKNIKFTLTEIGILISALLLFFFNELAPPYPGWQMRGDWIARLYQPLFAINIFFILRRYHLNATLKARYYILTIIFNCLIILGPIMNNPAAVYIYKKFYKHGGNRTQIILDNFKKYGTRPYGICQKSPKAP